MNRVYMFEEHSQLLQLWRKGDFRDLRILHLDAHCDLRGSLIDQKENRAYKIGLKNSIDNGNFLAQALFEGRISSIRWIHDFWGGRKNDIFTVKYNTDLSAPLYRLIFRLFKAQGLPIKYDVIEYEEWKGLNEGEHLDIDWDFFANYNKSRECLIKEVKKFLNINFQFIPAHTYISYSPGYVYPSKEIFELFVRELTRKFDAELIILSEAKEAGDDTYQILRGKFISVIKNNLCCR